MNDLQDMTAQGSAGSLDAQFPPVPYEQWLETALAGLGDKQSLASIERVTLDGIGIRTLYTEIVESAGSPIQLTTAKTGSAGWDNRLCLSDTSNPGATNRRLLTGLQGGISSLELHVNDPEHLSGLLEQVDLGLAPVSLKCGAHLSDCVDALYQLLEQRKQTPGQCRFSFNCDPLGDALRHGGSDQSLQDALKQMCRFCADALQRDAHCQTVLADGTVHHNAGASPVQELVACIASATLYLEQLLEADIEPQQAAAQISFQMAVDGHVLLNVAKLRALRVLWQRVVNGICGASGTEPLVRVNPVLMAETSRRHVSGLDNWNTHLRNLQACMAAAFASTSGIIVHPHPSSDTALADRMARNTAIIVEREAGLLRVSDPFQGSYAVESLTSEMVRHAAQALEAIDTSAGWMEQLQHGQWQNAIARVQAKRIKLLTDEKQIMVGVNRFPPPEEHRVDTSAEVAIAPVSQFRYPIPALLPANDAQLYVATSGESL